MSTIRRTSPGASPTPQQTAARKAAFAVYHDARQAAQAECDERIRVALRDHHEAYDKVSTLTTKKTPNV